MYCRNCGSEIAEGSKFCNQCGSAVENIVKVEDVAKPKAQESNVVHNMEVKSGLGNGQEEPSLSRPLFEEFKWDVSDYPDRNVVEKTEEINFNWNADPASIMDSPKKQDIFDNMSDAINDKADVLTGKDLETEVFKSIEIPQEKDPQEMSAADRIDKFYTFNKKNEEFQKLINKEYQRVKSGNAIEHEMNQADILADERFKSRPEDSSMEAFLEKEGIVKPYEPKAFQSDVLQRIEAQEAEREAKRLEEEARLKAIEEARAAAEAEKKAQEEARLAEEARIRAEEEARKRAEEEAAKLEEIARKQAEEEARLAEEARIRAEEEAKRQAEEEARRRAEEEARLRAEAEARVKAAEEARLRAEADLKAAQEAAKIRAQQEARLAAEAEAQFKAEQERKRLEAEEAQKRLEEKRRILTEEANQAVAQEEARKVLEHTARLRAEEEYKIKAAVADLRNGSFAETPTGTPAAAPTASKPSKEVEEAHIATKTQISEMAKAREAFFADFDTQPQATEPSSQEEIKPVTGRDTMLSSDDMTKTRAISKADIVAGLNEPTIVAKGKSTPAPASDEEFFNSLNAMTPDEIPQQPQPLEFKEEPEQPNQVDEMEDLLSQFEDVNSFDADDTSYQQAMLEDEKPGLNDTVLMPKDDTIESMPSNDFDSFGEFDSYGEPTPAPAPRFDYESTDADGFYDDNFYGDDEDLSPKEKKQRAKEEKRLAKERAKEEKNAAKRAKKDYIEEDADYDDERGGKGRIVLKVILIILIIILAIEVVGMGIRFLAPQSKAAEIIDNQLNKVIQLITGDDTEYSVLAAQVRTEPLEDKTDLINAQISKNKNGNIESIVYNKELAYDQETDGQISDLVLSQPITVVEWGRDDKNHPVFYDEQVVGQIIAFLSNKVELMNNGDETALGMVAPDTKYYKEVKKLSGKKMDGEFKKLEIGEIRQAGSNYFVWVRETIGDNTIEKVYSMYPEDKYVMKMANCYVI